MTDLFLGTGVGTKAYAIIEQGRIGQIVSSRPQDRRAIIEEAAGITRLINKLERAGFVRRDRSIADRRCVVCRLIFSCPRHVCAGGGCSGGFPQAQFRRSFFNLCGRMLFALVFKVIDGS